MEPTQNPTPFSEPIAPTPLPADPVQPAPPLPPAPGQPPLPSTPVEPVAPPEPMAIPPEPISAPVPTPLPTPEPSVTPAAPVISAPAPEAASGTDSAVAPKRILLVEDDDSLANVYTSRLKAENFDVKRVANGEEALATALSYHPNLVLLDVMMPRVSGFDVLDIMRNTPETANLKVIMLTALSQDSDVERAKSLGADEYLIKSQVVIADVIDRVRHQLNIL